jgi:short-subunit dehydrogenase
MEWVLITGASAGIGAEFARQYATRGHPLLLIARRRERLAELAASLTSRHRVQVRHAEIDLAAPSAAAAIANLVEQQEIAVHTLVNNAGYGVPGSFLSQPWSVHADFQQVMVNTIAELTYRLLPAMRSRRSGTVINVASLAGHMPGSAGHTLYGPAKAWLIKFSECLAAEVRSDGIRVVALCPGFTYTEFHDVNGMRPRVARLPRWLWMSPEVVVAAGIAAAERGDVVTIPGRINRLLALSARLLPRRLVDAAVATRAKDFRRVD